MDNQRLGALLEEHFPNHEVEGQPGLWRIDLAVDDEKPPADAADQNGAAQPGANGAAPEPQPEQGGPGAEDHLPPMLLVITDERANRMRIMTPIRRFDPQREEDLRLALIALHANYDRALDARYAVHEGVLWSVFIHPLGSLTSADLTGALRQVLTLRENTGTTYSSGDLFFGGGEEGPPQEPPASDAEDDVI